MRWRGSARFGVSLVYGSSLFELRFTNLTEEEARETISRMGTPKNVTTSRENSDSSATDTKIEAQRLVNRLRRELGFRPLEFRRRRGRRVETEFDRDIKIIRKALKSLCPTLSVRRDRGTAYGWIDISGSGRWREFTEAEKEALERFGLNYGGNCAQISPEGRKFWVERAKEILGL